MPIQQMLLGAGVVATKTYVDDVFSTFLYEGTGASQIIKNDIALGSSMSGNSINLSDTSENERLTRTSALSGVSAGKTFTVSAWVFIPNTGTYGQLFYVDTGSQTRFELGFGNYIQISARNSSNTKFLDVYTASNVPITPGQWNHILVSMDLTNTSNRHVYVNDSNVSMTYDGYGNEDILFNESKVSIFGQDDNNSKLFGHLSNFYFDQTYRNLGTTSNRRLFYAADGTPATGQASLSPIIYYSFDTLSTTNAGSGGDFTFVDSPTLGTFGPYKDTDAANGGMVWIKNREDAWGHALFDTERGVTKRLRADTTDAETTLSNSIKSFNTKGFLIGSDANINTSNEKHASFTFRKAPGFFDVVTYTGSGSARTIAHSLASVPGCIMIKRTDSSSDWIVYHRSVGPEKVLFLNESDTQYDNATYFNDTAPTSSVFSLKDSTTVNASGGTYVAYLFAHDEQSFGKAGDASVIKCDSYTGNGSATGPEINLGWEPQWLLIKNAEKSENWLLFDSMRGIVTGGDDARLRANLDHAESTVEDFLNLTPTGFQINDNGGDLNENGDKIVYLAIRRPDGYVGKPPELGTSVFSLDVADGSTDPSFISNFPVDFSFYKQPASSDSWYTGARLIGTKFLKTDSDAAEATSANFTWDYSDGWRTTGLSSSWQAWSWKRNAGLDVVTYTGDGTAGRQLPHGLNAVPEMMWVKRRTNGSGGTNWLVYHKGLNGGSSPEDYYLLLNGNSSEQNATTIWNDTAPTSTHFTVGNNSNMNQTDKETIAFLFASVSGISKVGSYAGSGSSRTISLGFSPRLLILKNITSADSWYVMDTTRGWGSGNDNYLELNTSTEQGGHDFGAPTSDGFSLPNGNVHHNQSGQTYIYYAHS